MDWVANASDFETFGNTSYEANSVGTPCILHPAGGHLSQIEKEGTNGFYVDFDRSDEEVRSHLESFINSPPPADVVKMNVVRKSDAVTVLDVVTERRRSSGFGRSVLEILKLPILFLCFLLDMLIVGSAFVLAGYKNIPADTREDRALRKLKVKRKRDVLKNAILVESIRARSFLADLLNSSGPSTRHEAGGERTGDKP